MANDEDLAETQGSGQRGPDDSQRRARVPLDPRMPTAARGPSGIERVEIGAPLLELFLIRHPYLTAFAASPTCAIVGVKVSSYQLVSSFQQVVEWHISA